MKLYGHRERHMMSGCRSICVAHGFTSGGSRSDGRVGRRRACTASGMPGMLNGIEQPYALSNEESLKHTGCASSWQPRTSAEWITVAELTLSCIFRGASGGAVTSTCSTTCIFLCCFYLILFQSSHPTPKQVYALVSGSDDAPNNAERQFRFRHAASVGEHILCRKRPSRASASFRSEMTLAEGTPAYGEVLG